VTDRQTDRHATTAISALTHSVARLKMIHTYTYKPCQKKTLAHYSS